jgi:hypothetical protein
MKQIKKEEIYAMILTNEIDWISLSRYYSLSEEIIDEFVDKWNWEDIFYYQKLSESFLEKYLNKINSQKYNWYYISKYQQLSESFIMKYIDKLNIHCILTNQSLSEEFEKELRTTRTIRRFIYRN